MSWHLAKLLSTRFAVAGAPGVGSRCGLRVCAADRDGAAHIQVRQQLRLIQHDCGLAASVLLSVHTRWKSRQGSMSHSAYRPAPLH